MKINWSIIAPVSLLIFLLLSCTSKSGPSAILPSESSADEQTGNPAKSGWQKDWDNTLIEAKKEGKVVVYGTAPGILRSDIGTAFRNKYGITVEDLAGRGAEVATKVLAERRAGLYIGDVYIGGSGTMVRQLKPAGVLDPLEPVLVLPEVLDPKVWLGEKLMWVDSPAKSILSFLAYPNHSFAVNTRLVRPDEIKSYRDFLNPKFKGKIVMNDPTTAGSGSMTFRVLGFNILDLDFFRELARQEPLIMKDQRLQVEWLAQGKYAIAYGPQTAIVADFQRAGAPLSYVTPAEGTYLSAGSGNVSLVNRAPHLKAARIFINWMLSREGVGLFSRAFGSHGARNDVSTEGIDSVMTRQPGVKYWIGAHTEEFQLKEPEMMVSAKEIFGPLLK